MSDDDSFYAEATVQNELDENALFSIDGERYPAQDVKAKVIPKAVRFFC